MGILVVYTIGIWVKWRWLALIGESSHFLVRGSRSAQPQLCPPLGVFVTGALFVFSFFLPRTPRYLVSQGKRTAGRKCKMIRFNGLANAFLWATVFSPFSSPTLAVASLQRLRGKGANIDLEITMIDESIAEAQV